MSILYIKAAKHMEEKLWYYNSYFNQILEADFEERPKSYKFVNRPSGFNSVVFKDMINRAVGDVAFAESKEKLIEVIIKKYNNDIIVYQKKIEQIEKRKESLKKNLSSL